MARHLTDREKKKIIADYAELGSCNAVAKKHKRSWTTIKQVVESDPDTMKKCEQKREENMRDVLAWMDAACGVLDKLLTAMSNDEIIGKSTISQIATAFGVVIDKFMLSQGDSEALTKARELLGGVPSVID